MASLQKESGERKAKQEEVAADQEAASSGGPTQGMRAPWEHGAATASRSTATTGGNRRPQRRHQLQGWTDPHADSALASQRWGAN